MITTSQIANEIPFKPGPPAASLLSNLVSGVKAAVVKVWRVYKAYRSFHAARAHLISLDSHMLKDIGIDRSEIDSVLLDRARERRRGASAPLVPTF